MKLTPTRFQKGRKVYWIVRVGVKDSGAEEPKRHYFKTRGDAKKFIEKINEASERLGHAAFTLDLQEQAQAVKAIAMLRPLGVSLVDAAKHFIATHPDGKGSPLFDDFADSFLRARRDSCKPRTLATYTSDLRVARPEFGKIPINRIFQSELEEWLPDLDLAPRTKNNVLDTMSSVFNDAIRKNILTRNPAEFVPRPAIDAAAPGILTPAQAVALLAAAKSLRPALVSAIAIALFGGLRRSELCSIFHRHVLLDEKLIEVPANVAKTRQRRLVTIRPNLALWLTHQRKTIWRLRPNRTSAKNWRPRGQPSST